MWPPPLSRAPLAAPTIRSRRRAAVADCQRGRAACHHAAAFWRSGVASPRPPPARGGPHATADRSGGWHRLSPSRIWQRGAHGRRPRQGWEWRGRGRRRWDSLGRRCQQAAAEPATADRAATATPACTQRRRRLSRCPATRRQGRQLQWPGPARRPWTARRRRSDQGRQPSGTQPILGHQRPRPPWGLALHRVRRLPLLRKGGFLLSVQTAPPRSPAADGTEHRRGRWPWAHGCRWRLVLPRPRRRWGQQAHPGYARGQRAQGGGLPITARAWGQRRRQGGGGQETVQRW